MEYFLGLYNTFDVINTDTVCISCFSPAQQPREKEHTVMV